jgi:hypothetical protein
LRCRGCTFCRCPAKIVAGQTIRLSEITFSIKSASVAVVVTLASLGGNRARTGVTGENPSLRHDEQVMELENASKGLVGLQRGVLREELQCESCRGIITAENQPAALAIKADAESGISDTQIGIFLAEWLTKNKDTTYLGTASSGRQRDGDS